MKYIFFALIIMLVVSCNHSIESKIADKIEHTCKITPCTIDIKAVTDFKWDKMYVFNYTATSEEVDSIIGSVPSPFSELTRRIIFTLQNKIVYSEEEETSVERIVNGEIVFIYPGELNFKSYSIDSSKFTAYRKDNDGTLYYELVQQ